MIKDKNKEVYTSPQTEVFMVRSEGMICTSPGAWDDSIKPGSNWGGNGEGYGME